MKNYWFVSEFYWPNENATGHIITRIVDVFSKNEKANVITVGNIGTKERNKNIHTTRIKSNFQLNKNNLLQRLVNLTILSIKMSVTVLQRVKCNDVVITVTNPAFILVLLAFFKNIRKYKLIILVHDVFPENLVIANIISKNNILYKIEKKVFDNAYNKGNLLLTCGRDMQRLVKMKVKDKNKVKFISNFADTDVLYPVEKKENKIIKELKLENKLVVLFTGNIGRMQNIDYLIDTMEILKNDNSIAFLFIGDGIFKEKIKNYSKQNNNVFYIATMNINDAYIFMNAGDVGISSLLPNSMGVGVPSKVYSYMATGKPIVAVMDNDSEIAMMIEEEGNGWVVSPSEPTRLAELLTQLKNDYVQIRLKGEISYKLSNTKYSIEKITNQYVEVITGT